MPFALIGDAFCAQCDFKIGGLAIGAALDPAGQDVGRKMPAAQLRGLDAGSEVANLCADKRTGAGGDHIARGRLNGQPRIFE